MNDIVNFDFTLNINQNEINESFRGILLVYNTKDELLGYIAGDEFNCFPSPNDLKGVSEEEYKNLGFGYRSAYIKDFVENWDNIIDRVTSDYDSDFNLLKGCKGIGDKVANCICLYGFEEYDAFPIDVWMKRIIKEEYEDKGKKLNIPNKYAGILQQYMFYTKRLEARE